MKWSLVAFLVILAISSATTFGHSGGTDSQGGHFNRRTGEYHFRHGMGPHQHPSGVCPYDRSRKQSPRTSTKAPLYLGAAAVVGLIAWANRKPEKK